MAILRNFSISLGRIIDLILTIPRKLLVFTLYMYVATGYFYDSEIVYYLPQYIFDTGNVALWQAFLSLIFSVKLGVISIAIGLNIAWRLPGIRTYLEGSFINKYIITEEVDHADNSFIRKYITTTITIGKKQSKSFKSIRNQYKKIYRSAKKLTVPLLGTGLVYGLTSNSAIYYSDIFHVLAVTLCPFTVGPVIYFTDVGSISPTAWFIVIVATLTSIISLEISSDSKRKE